MASRASDIAIERRLRLKHVFWIGGPPDSGKTTVAQLLADRHGFQCYHFDRHEMSHFERADPERHPALFAAHPDRMTTEDRWLGATPAEMAHATIASWSERVEMAIDDMLRMPEHRPIVAEGPGFFPERLLPLLIRRQDAIWLIPTPEFSRASAISRGKPGSRFETSDPDRATEQIIARDRLIAVEYQRQADANELPWVEVDSHATIARLVDNLNDLPFPSS